MITVTHTISGKYFSANIPDVEFAISGESAQVEMKVNDEVIYSEILYPIDGTITIVNLSTLLHPYARRLLVLTFRLTITENSTADTVQMAADVMFSKADVSSSCTDFIQNQFLSLLNGTRTTAAGRLEYLHYVGTESAKVVALYDDLTTEEFAITPVGDNDKYTTIDVSPNQFEQWDKQLLSYEVMAGSRTQAYELDLALPECEPVLIFENSFGVMELLYCTGTLKTAPTFKRDTITIGNHLRSYNIEETRAMTADTGIITFEQVALVEDLFRSERVYIARLSGEESIEGKEIIITDAKAERTNDADHLPRFSFTYQYAQHNHNIIHSTQNGRIFDRTFDSTFQ